MARSKPTNRNVNVVRKPNGRIIKSPTIKSIIKKTNKNK